MNQSRMTRLEQLRRDAGLTQADLSNETGVATTVISRIERGHGARLATVRTLADHFGVPASDLTRDALPVAEREHASP